jgi:hypothetical protein
VNTPFDKRLLELQLLNRPEDKEELALLEEWVKWKAEGGPKRIEADLEALRHRQYRQNYEGRVRLHKRTL